jgi:hypothetical protein
VAAHAAGRDQGPGEGLLRRVSPDDKRLLFVRWVTPERGTELVLTENWFQELEARAGK